LFAGLSWSPVTDSHAGTVTISIRSIEDEESAATLADAFEADSAINTFEA